MRTKEIQYGTPAEYLQDYDQHLRHGGLLVPWTPPPSLHSVVELILYLPPDQTRVRIKATVVTPTPDGVGVQFEKFGAELRAALEQNALLCRNIVAQMSQSQLAAMPVHPHIPANPSTPPPPGPRSGGFVAVVGSGEHASPAPSASGSWLTMNRAIHTSPSGSSIPAPQETSSAPQETSSAPDIRINTGSSRTFSPSPEDWNLPDQDINHDVLWSNSEIPVPSDLQGTDSEENVFPSTSYSSPEIDSPFLQEEVSPDIPVMRYPSQPSLPPFGFQPTSDSQATLAQTVSPSSQLAATSSPSSSHIQTDSQPNPFAATSNPSSSHIQSWLTREPVRTSPSRPRMSAVPVSSPALNSRDDDDSSRESTYPTADDSANLAIPSSASLVGGLQPPVHEQTAPLAHKAPVISPPPGSGGFTAYTSTTPWPSSAPDLNPTPLPRNVNRSAEQPSMHPSVAHLATYPSQDSSLSSGMYGQSPHEFLSSSSLDHIPQHVSLASTEAISQLSHEALVAYAAAYREMQLTQKVPDVPTWVGTFEDTPLLRVLNELAKRQATGLLEAVSLTDRGEETLKTYLYQGKVLLVEEHPVQEEHLLGNILVKDGRINSQERENALKKSLEQLVPIGEVLTSDKILAKRELSACLRKQMQKRLGRFTGYPSGSFQFWEKRLPRDKKLAPPTSPVKLLFRHKMDMLSEQPYEDARQLEDTYMDRYIFPAADASERLEDLGLLKEEMYFWDSMVTGRFRLRQIYAASNFRHRRTYVLVFALHAFDFLYFGKEMAADWQIEEMRDFFRRRHGLLGEETFFELLGIHWTSSQKDIEAAYKRIRRDYDISNYQGEWPQDIVQMSAEILTYLEKVHDHLVKGSDRREYRKEVLDDVKLRFSAELFEQQGDMAIYRRDFADAIERYERAIELNPNLNHLREKLQQAKAGLKKFQEAIQANVGKHIDYEARMQIKINTETLFRPDKKG